MSLVRRVLGPSRVRVLAQLPLPLESMRQYSLVTSFFIKNPNYETGHFCKMAMRAPLPELAFLLLPESPCPHVWLLPCRKGPKKNRLTYVGDEKFGQNLR